jgi:ParB family transcriptional regulator, chromosome partitioning protein
LARPDFRAVAARRLSEDRELSPAIVSLLSSENAGRTTGVKILSIDRIESNPGQPRMVFDADALHELSASIKEHGVLQPILVRPLGENRYQLIAGERRWRATREAGIATIPALVEEIDDDTALEISIIENLQREDLSPLEEATMFDRMVHEHGYSIRKLADKLGKDKGYLENRLRLADAPEEIRELVSLRKDTVSHAYELLKVQDPKKRKRLAAQVASGELSLVKLREKIEGRRPKVRDAEGLDEEALEPGPPAQESEDAAGGWNPTDRLPVALGDDSLVNARHQLSDAVEDLVAVLRAPDVMRSIPDVDRANLAKYLTIAKLKLENAIALVRSGDSG